MNRVIKFRAWDKNEKLMHDVIVIQRDEFVAVPEVGPDGWELRRRSLKDVDLMQFTGLLDKKGKEIYEGDAVRTLKFMNEPERGTDDAVVVYEGTSFKYGVGGVSLALLSHVFCPEVIGNIYENPELLNI